MNMQVDLERRTSSPPVRAIGIFGEEGSHTHDSFLDQFSRSQASYKVIFCPAPPGESTDWIFKNLVQWVGNGKTNCCLVPFFNTKAEPFHTVFRTIFECDVCVVDMFKREIVQNLISTQHVQSISDISLIISNQPCFIQTEEWRSRHMETVSIERRSASSEARLLIERNGNGEKVALIGSKLLTKIHNELHIVPGGEKIQRNDNYTSFFVVSKNPRNHAENEYSLYAFPVKSAQDKARIDERIASVALFSVSSSWLVLTGDKTPYLYAYQISTGHDLARIEKFEALLRESFPELKCWGRVNKAISQFMLNTEG